MQKATVEYNCTFKILCRVGAGGLIARSWQAFLLFKKLPLHKGSSVKMYLRN